ncbi:NAD(P)-dependent dehydrogenase (short-subunit alcohol dehydrogenase family) [Rhodoligotrophos appendicifer]|uniref:SDR family NAD(P)-dependent oxidoreductase n=1 Tax=Rhodoligotrophos appendicifer TaxID=987056 RepID=UPI00117DFFF6|nr:SDR family NAD(P)-dependent oxidoreductase [Rhodoligotrophos appendicifer]
MIRFDNRVALVTGAGAGLGRSYALLLAARGAKVVVNDLGTSVKGGERSSAAADAVVDEIRHAGGEAVANYDSVAEPDGAAGMIDMAVRDFGRLDILINNAGILRESPLAEMTLEDMRQVLDVHLMGTILCTQAALRVMLPQNYGRIVLTSSGSGLVGNLRQSVYGAAKAGMIGLMNCVRLDHAQSQVTINTVVPSAATRMSAGLLWETIERHMKPELIAPLVAWLCSEGCSRTGEIFNATGGHFARVALMKAEGVQFDPMEPVTPEMVADAAEQIVDMSRSEAYRGTMAALEPRLKALGRI